MAQVPTDPRDLSPLSIFAAALSGPTPTFETSVNKFFGSGTRAVPAEVAADNLSESIARPNLPGISGDTLFVFSAPVTLAPGQSQTLRYIYGMGHAGDVAALVSKYRAATDPLAASERAWSDYVPQADFGSQYTWVVRELQWDAYLLRSATVYEDEAGEHTITQGGYYQYGDGLNLGTRSWDHYEWPIVYSDPELAREILLYTIKLQPPGLAADAQLPYGTGPFSEPIELGTSDDFDFWLLQAAAEYGLATRDLSFFNEKVPYFGVGTATVWQHLKVAFEHMQTYRVGALHGEYLMGLTGDLERLLHRVRAADRVDPGHGSSWPTPTPSWLSWPTSTVTTPSRPNCGPPVPRIWPPLSARQWTGQGWYSRGYSGLTQVGSGVLFEEPQPWAILAGAPTPSQAATLVKNITRYLDGVGAPGGPTKIGSALVPGLDDPGVTQHGPISAVTLPKGAQALVNEALGMSSINGAAEWPGGVWFDPNGWLTWALASLQGEVPGAVDDAWSEYLRNTLATHATAFPNHWAGTISIDDVCHAYYSSDPADCGTGLSTTYDGQITEQPTWMEMNAVTLAGVTPVEDGYDITPHLPMTTFSLRMPQIGVASQSGLLRGYVVPQAGGTLVMHVAPPPGSSDKTIVAFADGVEVPSTSANGMIQFDLPSRAGVAADWAVEAT